MPRRDDFSCVTTNDHLKAWIDSNGQLGQCDRCGVDRRLTIDTAQLAQHIDQVIRAHYTPDMEFDGEPADQLIQRVAGVNADIAGQVQRTVHDDDNHGPRFYDYGPLLFRLTWPRPHLKRWKEFKETVKHEIRFVATETLPTLEELFGDVATLCRGGGGGVRFLTPADRIFRARLARSPKEARQWRRSPEVHLQAPPKDSAAAGRMNAFGVRVFYGALEEQIAVAETRPPIGSQLVVGAFTPTRPLRILDLGALGNVTDHVDLFDPEFANVSGRFTFLEVVEQEISRPIQPHDESLSYVPTQIFAEYLRIQLDLDGLAYRSAQTGEAPSFGQIFGPALEPSARNIVLFGAAALITAESVSEGVEPGLRCDVDSTQVIDVAKVEITYRKRLGS